MSAVEFGLASQSPIGEIPSVPFEQHYYEPKAAQVSEDDASNDEPINEAGFEDIVGRSAALRRVLRELEVARVSSGQELCQRFWDWACPSPFPT